MGRWSGRGVWLLLAFFCQNISVSVVEGAFVFRDISSDAMIEELEQRERDWAHALTESEVNALPVYWVVELDDAHELRH